MISAFFSKFDFDNAFLIKTIAYDRICYPRSLFVYLLPACYFSFLSLFSLSELKTFSAAGLPVIWTKIPAIDPDIGLIIKCKRLSGKKSYRKR